MKRLLCLLAGVLLAAGCLPGEDKACGAGSVEQDGKCVAATVLCGPGLTLVDGNCVAQISDADAGQPDGGESEDAGEDAGEEPCVGECGDRECGDDGCGVSCGSCAEEKICSVYGTCVEPAECTPHCGERECGDDGCGGSCGTCDEVARPTCQAGKCTAECIPDCYPNKECGDNGCGGSCGTCTNATTCDGRQRCVPAAWTCDDSRYGDQLACDCSCGTPDPDCAHQSLALAGCQAGEQCSEAGTCVSGAPAGWTCEKRFWDDGLFCDCGCGVLDPDCAAGREVHGCGPGATCKADGTCGVCTPSCDGRSCGPDGCGGVCGTCSDPQRPACVTGTCVNACSPHPVACESNECGDDGCGGSCGACPSGASCAQGRCLENERDDTNSCRLRCGSIAPSGCSCSSFCLSRGTCCPDYVAECGCTPQCDGKSCGADGCGGTCGTCPSTQRFCTTQGACTAACTPQCNGRSCGDDGCGGSCGTCASGSTCAFTGKCVPGKWTCDSFDYAEGRSCDCGCGVPDPDCENALLPTARCPRNVACKVDGYCDIAACDADGDCGALQCLGVYATGSGAIGGRCGPVYPGAEPPGADCEVNADCASNVCLGGVCRRHCAADADCPFGQHCLGEPVLSATLKLEGYVGVCERPLGSLRTCDRQAACGDHEICLPFVNPATKAPLYLCGVPLEGRAGAGESCEARTCASGLFCEGAAGSRKCSKACPGGVTDCPAGWACRQITFHNAGTLDPSDDPKVPVCAP